MIRNIFPTEVTTVVYSVKNLKPKKKDRQFCVLFSIGSVKYRTDPVEDESGNPVFNTESVLQVENPKDSLSLVVTERKEKEFYGQLIIPLHDLETSRSGHIFQKLLEPHKKCSKPTAEIHFEAWISKVVTSTAVTSDLQLSLGDLNDEKKKRKGLKGKLAGLVGSPKLSRKLLINRNSSIKNSRDFNSCLDLQSGSWNSLSNVSNSSLTLNSLKSSEARIVEDEKESEEEDRSPQITGISPNCGPMHGGTRITIRGEHLGTCRQDVVGLFVCGSNVLASLEYFSPSKVACTTKPWKPGEGTIAMETQSGGKSRSVIKFTFDGEVVVNVEGPDSNEVKRSESLKDSLRKDETKSFGTPQMPRANLGERGFLGSVLGIPGFKTSKSMLDLTAQDAQNSGKTLHASNSSHLLLPNATNQKKANGVKQPPIIQIQPMRLPESKFAKNINKWSTGTDPSNYKDLQVELDGYQTINSELKMKAHELENENKRLKEYIESLLSKIMTKCPEMLCNDRS